MHLTDDDSRRYARHLILPEIGPEGQSKFASASVVCVGAGGLGSPALLYLAAAGVGRIGIIDPDTVALSNLQRQILHGTPDVGRPKTDSAGESLRRLNPGCDIRLHPERLEAANALDLLGAYDVVIDGSDNLPTRYLTNDACVLLKKPLVYGAILRFEGQATVLAPHLGGPCYRCLFPEPPPPHLAPSCAEAGVLGVLPGLVGCIQATEALKLILGAGRSLAGRLLLVDALEMRFREIQLRPDPACPLCGPNPSITRLAATGAGCASGAAKPLPEEVSVQDLQRVLQTPGSAVQVIDVREPREHQAARLEGPPLIPLGTLPARLEALDPARPVYVVCRSGGRSLQAARFLRQHGFAGAQSVRGGLLAWAREIDPLLRGV